MRFKAKFIDVETAPVDDFDELDLPDDLAMLAEQLSDDASYLAARYPADSEDQVELAKETPRKTNRRVSTRLMAYTALASVLVLALVFVPSQLQDPQNNTASIDVPHHAISPTIEPENYPVEVSPAVFLQDVTGPEMEGLFDLMEQDAQAHTSVSI